MLSKIQKYTHILAYFNIHAQKKIRIKKFENIYCKYTLLHIFCTYCFFNRFSLNGAISSLNIYNFFSSLSKTLTDSK